MGMRLALLCNGMKKIEKAQSVSAVKQSWYPLRIESDAARLIRSGLVQEPVYLGGKQ